MLTFRGERVTADAGTTVNIPARAPHSFTNATNQPARLLCIVSPPGMEQFFAAFGDELASRTSPAPKLSDEQLQQKLSDAAPMAERFHIENLPPAGGDGQ